MNRIKFHVKKGDNVEVISGNFKGSSGKMLAVLPRKQRVLIEGVRIIKKHTAQVAGQSAGQDRRARRSDSHFQCEIARARRSRKQAAKDRRRKRKRAKAKA